MIQAITGPFEEAEAEFDKTRAALIVSIRDPDARALTDKLSASLALLPNTAKLFDEYAGRLPAYKRQSVTDLHEEIGDELSNILTAVSLIFACLPMAP